MTSKTFCQVKEDRHRKSCNIFMVPFAGNIQNRQIQTQSKWVLARMWWWRNRGCGVTASWVGGFHPSGGGYITLWMCSVSLRVNFILSISSVSSVAQSCPTLFDPMNRSTPGLPVHHQLPEFSQTHVLRVSDAIQPSHPQSSPSPPASNPSQHQSLFQWVTSSHEVAKVLEFQL